jgi:Gpi18-like mannosyltransferase
LLVAAAFVSMVWPSNLLYPITSAAERGWQFTPLRLIDIWARWDTGWYLDLAEHGYYLRGETLTEQSNVAFFPLFPSLVRALIVPLPAAWRTTEVYLVAGLAVSNFSLLAALALLRQLLAARGFAPDLARRVMLYLLVFPTSFFTSAFYTEAIFLLVSVAAFYAAERRAWLAAGILGALTALSRPLGVTVFVPLAWLLGEQAGWKPRQVPWRGLWLLLVPAAFLGHFMSLYPLTGHLLAPMLVQQAWSRGLVWPWQTILSPSYIAFYITPLDELVALAVIPLAILAARLMRSAAYGIHLLLVTVPALFTGSVSSLGRYALVAFPIFVALTWLSRRPGLDRWVVAAAMLYQLGLMAAWTRFYWVA